MTEVTAQLNSYRQSPRKIRLVVDAIKGQSVKSASNRLDFMAKRATVSLRKLLNSAIANAKNAGLKEEGLKIKSITVNSGKILYRRQPAAHGSAHPIRKRTSRIKLVLSDESETKNSKIKN